MMEEIGRKHPVHQSVHERRDVPIIVYLTVCTKRRKPILASAAAHELLRTSRREARSWLVGRYVVMPDHIHLFCAPAINYGGTGLSPVPNIEGYKFGTTQRSSLQFAREMDRILEVSQRTTLARSAAGSGLAAPFLGYAVAQERKLRSKVAIRYGERGLGRPGDTRIRLGVSGRIERIAMVMKSQI